VRVAARWQHDGVRVVPAGDGAHEVLVGEDRRRPALRRVVAVEPLRVDPGEQRQQARGVAVATEIKKVPAFIGRFAFRPARSTDNAKASSANSLVAEPRRIALPTLLCGRNYKQHTKPYNRSFGLVGRRPVAADSSAGNSSDLLQSHRRSGTLSAGSTMDPISYVKAGFAVRDDLAAAHQRAWERLARPGNWWTNFERMVRIADATGIPLDDPVEILTSDVREGLGINDFTAAANTPAGGLVRRALAPALRPILGGVLRYVGSRRRNRE
jgi:hypothetical protein